MGKNREHNTKVLENYKIGLSAENKRQANNIINMYKDNIINNYKQAQNLLNKLSSRGTGQQKSAEKTKQITHQRLFQVLSEEVLTSHYHIHS